MGKMKSEMWIADKLELFRELAKAHPVFNALRVLLEEILKDD